MSSEEYVEELKNLRNRLARIYKLEIKKFNVNDLVYFIFILNNDDMIQSEVLKGRIIYDKYDKCIIVSNGMKVSVSKYLIFNDLKEALRVQAKLPIDVTRIFLGV